MNTSSLNTKSINASFEKIKSYDKNLKVTEGEIVKVKLLEYLGGGKMIVDLKGQRVVANSDLMMEKGQDISVLIKNINDDKIILQIISDGLSDKEHVQNIKFSISDSIRELKNFLGNIDSQITSSLNDRLKRLSLLLDKSHIHITDDTVKEDISDQIQNSLSLIGYDYESKIAHAIKNSVISKSISNNQIKAELLQVENDIIEAIELLKQNKNIATLQKLFLSVDKLLEEIELYQVKSNIQADDFVHFLLALPVFFGNQETTVEFDYSHPKNDTDDDKAFDILIKFNLDGLGKIEFLLNLVDNKLNCLIKTDNNETFDLIKKNSTELENDFLKLGYDVDNINCMMQNLKNSLSYHTTNIIDKNA